MVSSTEFRATAAGILIVKATIVSGIDPTTNYEESFSINVVPPLSDGPSTVRSVSVEPSFSEVPKGSAIAFTAKVSGTGGPSQAVTWSVTGNKSEGTSITSSGILTIAAGETAATLTVTATSVANSSVSGTATVKVTAGGTGEEIDETSDEDNGNNTILWIAVIVVLIVVVALAAIFLIKRPRT
jgi:cobalamin biosynthesis Mg chelatase CobN